MFVKPGCAVCVCVMLDNHSNNFLAYASQVWPDKKRGIPSLTSLS